MEKKDCTNCFYVDYRAKTQPCNACLTIFDNWKPFEMWRHKDWVRG